MTALDATGVHALEQFSDQLRKAGKTLLVCGAREQPARLLGRSDFLRHIGAQNLLPNVQAALDRARQLQGDFSGVGPEMALQMVEQSL
jgi:SulP family sulfate permease